MDGRLTTGEGIAIAGVWVAVAAVAIVSLPFAVMVIPLDTAGMTALLRDVVPEALSSVIERPAVMRSPPVHLSWSPVLLCRGSPSSRRPE